MTTVDPPFFLTPQEYRLVEALVEAVIPAGSGPAPEPGGHEVGAHNYFDSRILDLPEGARPMVRAALQLLEDKSKQESGKPFADLPPTERQRVLRSLLLDPATMAPVFVLRIFCVEGFYSDYRDPSYTGRTAWDIVEFKGKRIDGIKKDWSFLRNHQAKDGSP